jgi:hypothetical protein
VCQSAQKRYSSDYNYRVTDKLFDLEADFAKMEFPEGCLMAEDCDCRDCSYDRAVRALERREHAEEDRRYARIQELAKLPMYQQPVEVS